MESAEDGVGNPGFVVAEDAAVEAREIDWSQDAAFSVNFGAPPDTPEGVRYMVAFHGGENPKLALTAVKDSEIQTLDMTELPEAVQSGDPFELIVVAVDNTVTIYINGEMVLEVPDVPLPPTQFGIRVGPRQTVAFDSFEVWRVMQ